MNAILAATAPEHANDGVERSPLEADFDGNWPDALQFLPPAGDDAAPIPKEEFAPNPARAEIFDGYTFVFYEKKQFENLMPPITAGKGKALLKEVLPEETQIDDFIRYVKGIAGEKGLGEFEDGSEGKGVVVVQFMPTDQEHLEWYTQFYTTVSLRLDQRLITQRDFLPAILSNDASGLRRPLEEELEDRRQASHVNDQSTSVPEAMDVDNHQPAAPSQPPLRRRQRGAAKSRFKGFGVALDDEDEQPTATTDPPLAAEPEPSQEGLFVSQVAPSQEIEIPMHNTRQSQRKRPAPSAPDPEEVMDTFAPTAAQVKRRRLAAGEEPRQATPTPPPEDQRKQDKPVAKTPRIKKEIDILGLARQHREEAEARAKAEREELATAPEGLDLAEIRRLQIEEPMELRQALLARSRDQDVAEGRWDPAWNGRKNFKRFQRRGATQGRPPQRIVVPLEEVHAKAYGISDDYWLEEDNSQARNRRRTTAAAAAAAAAASAATITSQTRGQGRSQSYNNNHGHARTASGASASASARALQNGSGSKRIEAPAPVNDGSSQEEDGDMLHSHDRHDAEEDDVDEDEDEDEDEDDVVIPASKTTRSTRASTERTTQRSQRSQRSGTPSTQQLKLQQQQQSVRSSRSAATSTTSTAAATRGKRAAGATPPAGARAKPAKRPRVISIAASDDEESEDELRFRFGRR